MKDEYLRFEMRFLFFFLLLVRDRKCTYVSCIMKEKKGERRKKKKLYSIKTTTTTTINNDRTHIHKSKKKNTYGSSKFFFVESKQVETKKNQEIIHSFMCCLSLYRESLYIQDARQSLYLIEMLNLSVHFFLTWLTVHYSFIAFNFFFDLIVTFFCCCC